MNALKIRERHLFQNGLFFMTALQVWKCKDDSEAPIGLDKMVIPGMSIIYVEREMRIPLKVINMLEE